MVLLSISFENMHQILRNLYDTMTKLCHPMMDMAMALAALGALFYIAYRVWQSLSRAEPIDVFSMLRPFVLGMCILFFDVMVLGTLNGIFSPIVQGTGMLLRDQTFDLQKYQQEKDKLRADMMAKTMMTGRVFAYNEELDAELDNMGWSEEEHTVCRPCMRFRMPSPARYCPDGHAQIAGDSLPVCLAGHRHDPYLLLIVLSILG